MQINEIIQVTQPYHGACITQSQVKCLVCYAMMWNLLFWYRRLYKKLKQAFSINIGGNNGMFAYYTKSHVIMIYTKLIFPWETNPLVRLLVFVFWVVLKVEFRWHKLLKAFVNLHPHWHSDIYKTAKWQFLYILENEHDKHCNYCKRSIEQVQYASI